MAKYEIPIPFILHCETGLSSQYTALPLEQMMEHARKTGFACDPDDPGGATMCGVTIGTYRAYRTANRCMTTTVDDLKRISPEEWREIYRLMFWNRWKGDLIDNQQVANALVDWLWTSGANGIIYPQKLLKVKADGIVGPNTLRAINAYPDQHELFDRIQESRHRYHRRIVSNNPKLCKYMRGWKRRVNKIKWEGYDYE